MHPTTRSREYREGWTGRRRWYRCRICGERFLHDGHQLPEKARICTKCTSTSPEAWGKYQAAFAELEKGCPFDETIPVCYRQDCQNCPVMFEAMEKAAEGVPV